MKILQVGKFYPIRGGVEKVMYDLTRGLSQKGVSCDMLCATTDGFKGGTIRLSALGTVIALPTMVKAAATTIAPKMILWLRKHAYKYDIIHIHHPDPMAALALFLSGYKGKVILHWHSDIVKQKSLLKLYLPLQQWLIKRANLILGTSPVYVAESPYLQNVQDKVSYLPIGVDPLTENPISTEQLKQKHKGKKIVFTLGRLVEYKGYSYLVEAAQYLTDDTVLIIGGTGPLKAQLQQQIDDLGLQNKIELIGFVPDEEMPKYFYGCDLFCLSSILKTEAFGIVQIEAMACSKPIVSTRIEGSGVSWVNKNNVSGIVVEPRDAYALAQSINKILSDNTTYKRLSEGARQRYQEVFTLQSVVDKAIDIFHSVLRVNPD